MGDLKEKIEKVVIGGGVLATLLAHAADPTCGKEAPYRRHDEERAIVRECPSDYLDDIREAFERRAEIHREMERAARAKSEKTATRRISGEVGLTPKASLPRPERAEGGLDMKGLLLVLMAGVLARSSAQGCPCPPEQQPWYDPMRRAVAQYCPEHDPNLVMGLIAVESSAINMRARMQGPSATCR